MGTTDENAAVDDGTAVIPTASNGEEGSISREEEKIEEDANNDIDCDGSRSRPGLTLEDEQIMHSFEGGANEHQDLQQNNENKGDAASATIAVIPPSDNDDSTEAEDENANAIHPGVVFVAGPDFSGTRFQTGYHSDADDGNTVDINEQSVMLVQGFLPEDDPSRRSSRPSRAERRAEERIQRLIDNAITLDDSAVQPIPMEDDVDEEGEGSNGLEEVAGNSRSEEGDEDIKSDNLGWFVPLIMLVMTACVILAIAIPISLRRKVNKAEDSALSFNDDDCLPGEVYARFEVAKSILSSITSQDLLEDESTPQGKAIRWIACEDSISVRLLENQDTSTGKLPKQKHGFRTSGDSGEAQVTRRYILTTLSYSTTKSSPWLDTLNFVSPDLHECNWHRNYTRQNFPHGDYDPVGVFCTIDKGELSGLEGVSNELLLDDEDFPLRRLAINIRIDNNLNGPLPPEIGYLLDCFAIGLENNIRLSGVLPETMGNMIILETLAVLLNGPKFGGEIPSSLFRLKNLITIQIQDNLGKNWSLPSSVQVGEDTRLESLSLSRSGITDTIPSWLTKLSSLQTLDLSRNNFQGGIPDTIGDLSSIKYLSLMDNNLTETIPSSIGKLSAIEALLLGNNQLRGELPASIGNLQTLLLLDVGSNEMTSTLPPSFANLSSLKYLVLESNKFNGTVDVLASLKNLAILLIRSNSFSGTLPDGLLSEASDNVAIDVGDNGFTGELPMSFANMSNLVSLIGARNSFVDNTTHPAVCNDTSMLVMDCDACECCEVCCEGNNTLCDFKLDARTILGYDCGAWFRFCIQGPDYFEGY